MILSLEKSPYTDPLNENIQDMNLSINLQSRSFKQFIWTCWVSLSRKDLTKKKNNKFLQRNLALDTHIFVGWYEYLKNVLPSLYEKLMASRNCLLNVKIFSKNKFRNASLQVWGKSARCQLQRVDCKVSLMVRLWLFLNLESSCFRP